MSYSESDTRSKLIDPAIKNSAWLESNIVRGSYKINGEQIDGSFSLDNTEYNVEAKWHTKPIDHTHIVIFIEKINTRLENTLGLFISHSSFTDTAVKKANQKNIILMDGEDLVYVLDSKIDYVELLRKKKKYASQTGSCFYKARDIIGS